MTAPVADPIVLAKAVRKVGPVYAIGALIRRGIAAGA